MFSESDSTRGTTVCLDRGALRVTHVLFAVAAVAAAPIVYLPGACVCHVCDNLPIICLFPPPDQGSTKATSKLSELAFAGNRWNRTTFG